MFSIGPTKRDLERFIKKISISNESECWVWTGCKMKSGYGMFKWMGIATPAHRCSYEFFVETLEPDEVVHHSCENNSCVNPRHLKCDMSRSIHIAQHVAKRKRDDNGRFSISDNT